MSKKATRRAARQAFPKAPAPGTKSSGGKTSTAKGKARVQALKPPSWKRAAVQGAILAALYFVVIQFLWKGSNSPNVWSSLLIAVIGFVAYSCIAYLVDRFNYNRRLRKLKGSAK
jgi:hypothetical protein